MDSIFFSEFDNIAGPKVTFQDPEGALTHEVFDSISEYIITKPQLCGKVIGIKTMEGTVLGCPVCIEHAKYQRNALFFNVAFVFPSDMSTEAIRPYRPVVKKLAALLYNMEVESEFLFREESKKRLKECIGQIREQLNRHRECAITIEGQEANPIFLRLDAETPRGSHTSSNCQYLNLYGSSGDRNNVGIHSAHSSTRKSVVIAAPYPQSVPLLDIKNDYVPIVVVPDIPVTRDWDLSLQFIVPLIDGALSVIQIAKAGCMDVEIVKNALHHLVYFGCIRILPPFKREDSYCVTPKIRKLAFNKKLQLSCIQFIALHEHQRLPDLQTIFLLYSRLVPGISLRVYISEYDPASHAIDIRRMITFGLVHDFLCQVPHYTSAAALSASIPSSSSSSSSSSSASLVPSTSSTLSLPQSYM